MGLDVVTVYAGIDPDAIPGRDLQPDDLERLATDLVGSSRALRAGGADLVDRWRALSAVYEAPEAPTLLDGILPVEPAAARYADALAQVASAVREYAETIRPLQRTLSGLRDDARSFRTRAAARERWDGDQDLVDENTRLVHAVGVQQSLLDEAARQCALRIRAATRGDSALRECTPDGLHLSRATTLPADDQPWGHVVRRHDPCPKSAAVQIKHFLWDGIAVDGVWAGVTGSSGYYGLDTRTWEFSLATARTTWASMPDVFRADELGSDVRYEAAKSLLAWDTWSEDPARAAGAVVFTFVPGAIGLAGTAMKGTRAAGVLGRAGTARPSAATQPRVWPDAPEPGTWEHSLGHDPSTKRWRPVEYRTAIRIMEERGVRLERAGKDERYDWIDARGTTYDAVGGQDGAFLQTQRQWSDFLQQIDLHLDKADLIPVDVSGFSAEQIARIRAYVAPLDNRYFFVGEP
ncbi:hypothetical protein ACFO3K_06050 [Cellulomonas algicola]|uniref:hypothetical protein n=1 Tax=Cellulomonas algicola TaxID=2071633 RepID=UPI001C3F81FA|nr:hypothetical protein [Cellulomonas algicola]